MLVRSLIKDELEPHMRDFSPSAVNGLYFERLSFGLVPMSIMGVRIVPQTYSGQNVAIGECLQSQTNRKEYLYAMCWSLICMSSLNLQSKTLTQVIYL